MLHVGCQLDPIGETEGGIPQDGTDDAIPEWIFAAGPNVRSQGPNAVGNTMLPPGPPAKQATGDGPHSQERIQGVVTGITVDIEHSTHYQRGKAKPIQRIA